MLSDDALNKLMQPIIQRQEYIDTYVLTIIAERIKETGTLLPSDLRTIDQIIKTGADVRKINAFLASATQLQQQDIMNLLLSVASSSYLDARPFYAYTETPFIPFEQNKSLQNIVQSIGANTVNTYKNLSNTTGFTIRNKVTGQRVFTSISLAYQQSLDTAIQAVQLGVTDYSTAIRGTLKELMDSGLRVVNYTPDSGRKYSRRLDSAVRMNILDGVRAINQGVQDEVGKQFGADGKEISVHGLPAPDHAPIQGHQFTNEQYANLQSALPFEDVNGVKYTPIERAIGEWNCRHFAWSIIVGATKPMYTTEQLQGIIDKNNDGYTMRNGKHYTLYECSQYMRNVETSIRRLKNNQMISKEAGDYELAKRYDSAIDDKVLQYKTFSSACHLPQVPENIYVAGYKEIKKI